MRDTLADGVAMANVAMANLAAADATTMPDIISLRSSESEAEIMASVAALGKVLLKVTLAQVMGYVMKARRLIPDTAISGIGAFAGLVSLPCVLFRAVAMLDFGTVQLDVVVALIIGKIVLLLISALTGKIYGASEGPGGGELAGGCLALLTTNSDDLGLGLPVLGAIFPPSLVNMCFVLSAVQMIVFNPLIFMLFGVGAAKRDTPPGEPQASNADIVVSVLRGLTKNFVILSVVLGLAYNGAFGGLRGAHLPFFLDDVCVLLGSAFGPMVLYMAGAANVGSFEKLAQLNSALMPLLSVLLKSILLPTIVMSLLSLFGASRSTMDFAFAFNCLPTAGSTLVFAAAYRPSDELKSLLSAGLALGKLLGFPLLFLSAAIFKTKDVHDVLELEERLAVWLQMLSAASLVPLLASAIWYRPWARRPLRLILVMSLYTLGYTLSSALSTLGFASAATAFGLVSFCRWAADAVLVLACLARFFEATARLKGHDLMRNSISLIMPLVGGGAPDEAKKGGDGSAAGGLLPFALELALSVVVGLALTLPWSLTMAFPKVFSVAAALSEEELAEARANLPLWVPYGDVQEGVYALIYGLCALVLLLSTSKVMLIENKTASLIEERSKRAELTMRVARLKAQHAFYVRFECLVFVAGTRLVLSSAICAQLMVDKEDAMLTGSMALMLLTNCLLTNSAGLLLFFLFGVGEGCFAEPVGYVERLLRQARLPSFEGIGGGGGRGIGARAPRKSVHVEELKDLIDATASGTGYREPQKLWGACRRTLAANTIQRYQAKKKSIAVAVQQESARLALERAESGGGGIRQRLREIGL